MSHLRESNPFLLVESRNVITLDQSGAPHPRTSRELFSSKENVQNSTLIGQTQNKH